MSHTIDVADITSQDTVLRALRDIQSHGASYTLVQDGVEIAKVVPAKPVRNWNDKVSDEVAEQRRKAMAEAKELSKEIARRSKSGMSAVEEVINSRR